MRTLVLAMLLAGCWGERAPEPVRYTVVRGDTLGEIATEHGVTVDQLRAWNGLEGDLIEVGQVLLIHADGMEAEVPAKRTPRKRTARPKRPSGGSDAPSPAGLRMPAPEACLDGPDGEVGERGMSASRGLDAATIRPAVDAVLPHTADCITGEVPSGTLLVELTVGCDGVVDRARIADGAGWPPEVASCVAEVLRHADFPAHDLPDGEIFTQPVRFTP